MDNSLYHFSYFYKCKAFSGFGMGYVDMWVKGGITPAVLDTVQQNIMKDFDEIDGEPIIISWQKFDNGGEIVEAD